MNRTKLSDRQLPDYSRGEEIMNMVTHIVGGAVGVVALTLCVIFAALHANPWGVVTSAIYGSAMVTTNSVGSISPICRFPISRTQTISTRYSAMVRT